MAARVLAYRSQTQDPPRDEVEVLIGKLYLLAASAPWCVHAVDLFVSRLLDLLAL
jgi:hypothetical protein